MTERRPVDASFPCPLSPTYSFKLHKPSEEGTLSVIGLPLFHLPNCNIPRWPPLNLQASGDLHSASEPSPTSPSPVPASQPVILSLLSSHFRLHRRHKINRPSHRVPSRFSSFT
ncbi:hypothetical protein E2C01_039817 [Portunus trituberculatus]|uniref:Uncharacterized protein n=1 Tax=Portunus trituberculatus TaxID=210409 RepID=A0A5B7FLP8_PORTR|nr:hypothetical protein [Portunus trituberculatus]